MRLSRIASSILFLCTTVNVYSQESPARFAAYFEGAGAGFSLIALHAEVLIRESDAQDQQVRLSIGMGAADMGHGSVPIYMKGLLFGPNNWMEFSAGVTYIHTFVTANPILPTSTSRIYPGLIIGYRQQPREGGFLFRLTFNPKLDTGTSELLFGAGMSLGWAF